MTTIATPVTGATTTSSRSQSNRWVALLIVVTALVMLAVATIAIVNTADEPATTAAVVMSANDPVAHGTGGNLMTTAGERIASAKHRAVLNEKQAGYNYMGSYGPGARATTATETDLLVHGGPGSAVTVSGQRLA